ncbi:MAG: hypothetical protein IJ666_03945 [Ruminococcus sp.]|nr:hypothetical protein [Ruminococcus sp.]
MILVGGETKESALTAVAGETYIRESANGQYYTGTDDDSHVYVFRPTATDGYICYIDGVRAVTDTDNSTFGSSDDFIAYAKKKIEEYKDNEILVEYASKELSDYLALDYVGKINYNHGLNLTTIPLTNKFTTTTTGEIMLRDGERAVFPKPRDKYRYI